MGIPSHLKHLYPFKSRYIVLPAKRPAIDSREGGGGSSTTPDMRLHFLDEGNGPPVLMLHGNPTWSFYYRNVIALLRGHFRCVVPDHIGFGLSSKPQHYSYRLVDHIENLCRLIESLRLKSFHLMVHDWGGAIGLGVAHRMPERVEKIVLLNTAAFRAAQMPWQLKLVRMQLLGSWLVRGLNLFVRSSLRTAVVRRLPLDVRCAYLFPYHDWATRIGILRFVQDIPMDPAHASYAALANIEAGIPLLDPKPVFIGWGMHDFIFTPYFLERWLAYFPSAEVHRFYEAGHYVLEDASDRVIPLIDEFLLR